MTAAGGGDTHARPLIMMERLAHHVPLPVIMVMIGGLFLGTLVISHFSLQVGVPAILGVLIFGLLINPSVPPFSHVTIEWLHICSLSILLFYAGLKTDLRSIRGFLEYGIVLAFGGAIVSSLLLGLIIWMVASPSGDGLALGFGQLPFGVAMLIASCLGSTDASATLSVLATVGERVPQRLRALLEFESSVNDPAAILFLGLVVGLATLDGAGVDTVLVDQAQAFVQKVGSGLLIGVLLGYVAHFTLDRLVREQEQLLVMGIGIGLLSYGLSDLLGGSGYISCYVTGLFLSNYPYRNRRVTTESLRLTLLPFNTMTEIVVFLIFGLVMNPARLLPSLPEGIVTALALMLVARPLSVFAFQWLSPFSVRESLLISWCGLRGAIPLALSFVVIDTVPDVPGVEPGLVDDLIRNAEGIVFSVVVCNLLLQGLSLPHVCRWLQLDTGEQTAAALGEGSAP